jgi:hypothetical protein
MKKIYKYLLVLALGGFSLTSCNMDVTPTTAISFESGDTLNLISNQDNLEKMENGILSSFRGCQYGEYTETEEVQCDGFNATVDYGNNYGGVHRCDQDFTSGDYYVQDMWSVNYGAIKNYNVYLSALSVYNPTDAKVQAEAKVCAGEAHFFRAWSYLQLIRHFAKAYGPSSTSDLGVPIVLTYNQNAKPARNTVAEVYAQIKKDLDEAATDLAGEAGAIRSEKPTIDAVNALMARYYLDTKNYTQAAIYAEKVISSAAGYTLAASNDAMTKEYYNDNGTEPIMQLFASLSENGSGTNDIYTLMAYYGGFASHGGGLYYNSYFLPSQKLLDLYEDNDLRLSNWFDAYYISYLGGAAYVGKYYTFVKYFGNPDLNDDGVPNGRQKVKPFMIGEMYLIAAEANFQAGNVTAAKTALNTLQGARGATKTEATLQNIKDEWFKETVGEGLRLSCLKRWGDGFTGRAGQPGALAKGVINTGASFTEKSLTADSKYFVWPIPSYELKVNENLVQNYGWGTSE